MEDYDDEFLDFFFGQIPGQLDILNGLCCNRKVEILVDSHVQMFADKQIEQSLLNGLVEMDAKSKAVIFLIKVKFIDCMIQNAP